jgi:hypothetical protein
MNLSLTLLRKMDNPEELKARRAPLKTEHFWKNQGLKALISR